MKVNLRRPKKSLRRNSRKFEGVSSLLNRDYSLTLDEDLSRRMSGPKNLIVPPGKSLPRKTKNPRAPEYEFSTEFDEDKWKEIRPLLQHAWEEIIAAGKSSAEFVEIAFEALGLKGRVYLDKFARELDQNKKDAASEPDTGTIEKTETGRPGDVDIAKNTSEGREVAAKSVQEGRIKKEKSYHVIWDDNNGNHIESYDIQKDAERRVAQLLINECEKDNNGCTFNTVIYGEFVAGTKLIVHVEEDDGMVSVKFKL